MYDDGCHYDDYAVWNVIVGIIMPISYHDKTHLCVIKNELVRIKWQRNNDFLAHYEHSYSMLIASLPSVYFSLFSFIFRLFFIFFPIILSHCIDLFTFSQICEFSSKIRINKTISKRQSNQCKRKINCKLPEYKWNAKSIQFNFA